MTTEAITAPVGPGSSGAGFRTEVAGAAVGWRVSF